MARVLHFKSILKVSIFIILCQSFSAADIKVGTYSWSHLWKDGTVANIPRQNQYGTGYTHLDLSWTWTMEDGFRMISNDWTSAANCLDQNPSNFGGHMSMQVANYIVKTRYPDLWKRIKAHSDAGRYDGGALDWQEGYWMFGGDEYYLRNYYTATRFCFDNFGYLPIIAACYDLDAAAWTQPKIQNYVVGRSPENPLPIGFYNHRTGAGGIWDPQGTYGGSYKWTSDDGSVVIVGTAGNWSGDGGGAETCVPTAGNSRAFAKKVVEENVWDTDLKVTHNDALRGSGSGYSLFWWGSKVGENRLIEAEKFSTFARAYGYKYPLHGEDYLYGVWGRLLMFNQHDVADVQGSPWQMIVSNKSNINMQDAIVHVLNVADSATKGALKVLSSNVNTSGSGTSVIVYNSLSWTRTDPVTVPLSELGLNPPVYVKDPSGNTVPSQVSNYRGVNMLSFTAENVPSLGLKEFKVLSGSQTAQAQVTTSQQGNDIILENSLVKVKISKTDASISSIFDKINNKEILGGPGNRIANTTQGTWWDDCCGAYSHGPGFMPTTPNYQTPKSVALTDSGPSIARVKLTYTIDTIDWVHTIELDGKTPIIRNYMTTDNLAYNTELYVNLPLNTTETYTKDQFKYGVAFGHQKWFNLQERYTFVQKWADMTNSAKTYGVSFLENNCTMYSYFGVGGQRDFRLVLIAVQPSRYKGNWSKKDWQMSWGIYGHANDWTNGTVQRAYEFNSPLIAKVETSHGGAIPKTHSFLSVEPENVIITAVKKWESEDPDRKDSLSMQVRFYETDGKNSTASFLFPSGNQIQAWESKGNEYGVYGEKLSVANQADGQKVNFPIGHNQIRSLKIVSKALPIGARWRNIPIHELARISQNSDFSFTMFDLRGRQVNNEIAMKQMNSKKGRISKGSYIIQRKVGNSKLAETRRVFSLK